MKLRQPECPRWAVKALQGLSYWIGYRHSLYAGHPLPEAALVTEACNLIHTNLRDNETLVCERLYRTLVRKGYWKAENQARVDLLVLKDHPHRAKSYEDLSTSSFVAIEVKRGSTRGKLIDRDLQRLAQLKAARPEICAMLFVISEARRPRRFVESTGVRKKGKYPIRAHNAYFRVLRACKATSLFSGQDSAHYSCILEVFLNARA